MDIGRNTTSPRKAVLGRHVGPLDPTSLSPRRAGRALDALGEKWGRASPDCPNWNAVATRKTLRTR
eukprot:5876781-Pyramimonas_sp.AAC.1